MMNANFGYTFPSGPLARMFASSHWFVTVVGLAPAQLRE
jgi:hypothetical protein